MIALVFSPTNLKNEEIFPLVSWSPKHLIDEQSGTKLGKQLRLLPLRGVFGIGTLTPKQFPVLLVT